MYSDQGTEFTGASVQKLFQDHGIEHFVLKGKHKASIVERFQRTIKSSLEMYFYRHKRRRWVDVIEEIVKNYNGRFHRSIKMAPDQVTTDNFEEVYKTLYLEKVVTRPCKLKVGDIVRIALKKSEFSKGYHQTYSDQLYKILEIVNYQGVCFYTVQSIAGGAKIKKYYEELNLVLANDSDTARTKNFQRKRALSD